MEEEDLSTEEELEEEEQSLNGKVNESTGTKENLCDEGNFAGVASNSKLSQINSIPKLIPNQSLNTISVNHTTSTIGPSVVQVDVVDPGRTKVDETVMTNELHTMNNATIFHANDAVGLTKKYGQIHQLVTSAEPHTTVKEKGSGTLMPKPTRPELGTQINTKEVVEILGRTGNDLDEESTEQNFINIAKQGDISPR